MTHKASVVIPLRNAQSTIIQTLESLKAHQKLISEIIVVNDASTDNSLTLVNNYFKTHFKKIKTQVFSHPSSCGLSASYNDGIQAATGDLIVTLHSDVILKKNALSKLLRPFSSPKVVASYHQVIHPFDLWKNYNFWQKCFFDRQLHRRQTGLDGKFDAFRKSALLKVGLFDNKTFFRAGEDGDIIFKLKRLGRVVPTKAVIIHLHDNDPSFSAKKVIYKHAQYSEAQGALLRHYGLQSPFHIIHTFFREMLLIGLFIPYLNYLSGALLGIYSLLYTRNTIRHQFPDLRVFLLPFVNLYQIPVGSIYVIKGFLTGHQTI